MSDIHIDDFYKDVAKVLTLLYSAFPRKSNLYVEDIAGPDNRDEFGLHSERHQACLSAMLWLAESGYIRYHDTIRQKALDQAWLTHKAFTLLSSPADLLFTEDAASYADLPDSVRMVAESNIHQLREALKTRASATIRRVVHQLLMQSKHHQ